jgi:hypothetical protein
MQIHHEPATTMKVFGALELCADWHGNEPVRVIGNQPGEWLVSARPSLLTYANTNHR